MDTLAHKDNLLHTPKIKMKNKTKPDESPSPINNTYVSQSGATETIQVGEVAISSSIHSADKLASIVLELLEKESVKKYLEIYKEKKVFGSITG